MSEKVSKTYWWCPECKIEVDGRNVTFEEKGIYNIRIGSMNPFELHVK